MNILLLGELSAFHKGLKSGLIKLGHTATIAGHSDGWKKIGVDVNMGSRRIFPFDRIEQLLIPVIKKKQLSNFDIVQFAIPLFFNPYLNSFWMKQLCNWNGRSFLCGISSGDPFYHFGLKSLDYSPFDEYSANNITERYFPSFRKMDVRSFNNILEFINGVIPSCFDYALGYKLKGYSKLRPTIPYPIDTDACPFVGNEIRNNKIKIFHGVSRPLFKGSRVIIDAMREIKRRYPNDIELQIVEKVPYSEYVSMFDDCNIFVDQCRSYSYGMNALIGLCKGKVVLSGSEPEAMKEIGVSSCPVVNIRPDTDQIIRAIITLLDARKDIEQKGFASRKYVELVHSDEIIAGKYLTEWRK